VTQPPATTPVPPQSAETQKPPQPTEVPVPPRTAEVAGPTVSQVLAKRPILLVVAVLVVVAIIAAAVVVVLWPRPTGVVPPPSTSPAPSASQATPTPSPSGPACVKVASPQAQQIDYYQLAGESVWALDQVEGTITCQGTDANGVESVSVHYSNEYGDSCDASRSCKPVSEMLGYIQGLRDFDGFIIGAVKTTATSVSGEAWRVSHGTAAAVHLTFEADKDQSVVSVENDLSGASLAGLSSAQLASPVSSLSGLSLQPAAGWSGVAVPKKASESEDASNHPNQSD